MTLLFKRLRRLNILSRPTVGLVLINLIVQRLFRINGRVTSMVHFTSKVTAPAGLQMMGVGINLERCLALNGGIHIQAANGVSIDRSVLIAPGVKIVSGNHDLSDFSASAVEGRPIEVLHGCWLGANSVVLPGVRLGAKTIVGAGAVVTKSFDEGNIIIAGNPAVKIRNL